MPLFNTPIDLAKNELRNPRLQNLSSNPASPLSGQFYYNTTTNKMRVFNGSTWDEFGTGGGTVTSFSAGNLSPLFTTNVANNSTTPALSFSLSNAAQNAVFVGPVSGGAGAPTFRALAQADLPSSVSLSYWADPTADLSIGNFKLTNVASATLSSDAPNWGQVQNLFNGIRDYKDSVRAASTANVTVTYSATGGSSGRGQITAAPNTLNGVTLAANDRILLKNQSAGAQNGIWVVTTLGTGANGVWDRASDFDSDAEVTSGLQVFVTEAVTTDNRGTYYLTTADPITIGGASGTALTFTQIGSVAGYVAGNGLTLTGLTFDVASANTGIAVNANDIALTLRTNSGLQINSGLGILSDTVTAGTIGLTLTSNGAGIKYNTTSFTETTETLELAAGVAGNGLGLSAGVLSVNVDNATIEINADTLRVKAAGIDHNHISSTALNSTLTGGSGTTIGVANYTVVSGTTVARKYTASTTFTTGAYSQVITHNLNTKHVQVYVYNTTDDTYFVTDVTHSTVNTVTVSGVNNSGATINAQVVVVG